MDKRLRNALKGLTSPDAESRRRAMEPFVRATFNMFIRHLYQCQLSIIGGFTVEFGVDTDKTTVFKLVAGLDQLLLVIDISDVHPV